MRIGKGQVAVVTGAAGGLGRALSVELARRGAHVALVDLDAAGLEKCHPLVAAHGVRVSLHVVDVADPDAADRLASVISALYGAVHMLVNNAGVTLLGRFEEAERDDLEWILGVNLRASWYLTRAFLPSLRAAAPAHVVNLSSVLGLVAAPGQVAYCTTKAAVAGFSRALRQELRGTGVGVTTVYAGALSTGIVAAARSAGPDDEARRDRLHGYLARKGTPPERAARKIVDAVRRGRSRVLVGHGAFWLDLTSRIAPGLADRLVSRRDLLGER